MSNRTSHKKLGIQEAVAQFCEKAFVHQKLNNWLGFLIFGIIALGFGYIMAHKMVLGIGIIVGLLGMGVLLICLFNTEAGFYINMIYSFFAFHFYRIFFYYGIEMPVGVISDALTVACLLSLFIRGANLRKTMNDFTSTKVVRFLLITYAYFAIQLFNPNAGSFIGWYNAFRKLLGILFIFFTAYNVINSLQDVKKYLKMLFILCAISGIYGCIQEWHGVFDFELFWLMSDPHGVGLAFIGGDFRKFSIMSDPAAYSIAMAAVAVLYIIISTGSNTRLVKGLLIAGISFMILGMSYSGTRTANAMLVAGLCFFIMFSFNDKKTRQFAIIGACLFCAVLYGPYNNPTIARFRTTFAANDDASYKVREVNRQKIQSYIYTHPIGGGLATTGGTGKTYNPGHYLAGFQPDSGYLKKALEIGYIGLALYCIMYFLILQAGIQGYFSSSDKEVKLIYAAVTCGIFCFYVGEYAQKAIGQITDIVIYYPLIVILLKLKTFSAGTKPILN